MEQIAPPTLVVGWSPDGALRILDQRRLPAEVVTRDLRAVAEVAEAIRTLAVRGAPAIGVAAAIGLAVASDGHPLREVERMAAELRATRPTAVNLMWALDRMLATARGAHPDDAARAAALRVEAERIRAEDAAMCLAIGRHGADLITDGMRILTHCNAGALATAGIGTALAPVYVAHAEGRRPRVWADETRPLLQGARLTAWELTRAGIPVTVLTDGMAASLMARDEIDLVIVGADRIAANGDAANKIGTYGLAVLAKHHGIPFVVAAPMSTVDPHTKDGAAIPIEQRHAEEVTHLGGVRIAAEGAATYNPAFDVTPHTLITRIVTDVGVFAPPYAFASDTSILPPPA
ncbi:MAG: S-methyl-5-thioribose-1-phosphate isomerase [Gemmatimonadaceae bacterium]|jgi:methylthioribose-1-phosphate isomerase|nr:S-methyl-5-thioribose-1-phosphate isomerase [Gemmatimonadaceae bacterium]